VAYCVSTRVVRRPDADAIARPEAKREQAGGKAVYFALHFCEAQAHALVARNEGFAVGSARGRFVEPEADRLVD
jgi:hypothetical protein